MERVLVVNEPTENVFCPTGKGGGVDPTCSPAWKGANLGIESETTAARLTSVVQDTSKTVKERAAAVKSVVAEERTRIRDSLSQKSQAAAGELTGKVKDPEKRIASLNRKLAGDVTRTHGEDAIESLKEVTRSYSRREINTSPGEPVKPLGRSATMVRFYEAAADSGLYYGKNNTVRHDILDVLEPVYLGKTFPREDREAFMVGGSEVLRLRSVLTKYSDPTVNTGRVLVLNEPVENVFCATGPGGGVDPTCPAGGKISSSSSPQEAFSRFKNVSQETFGVEPSSAGIFEARTGDDRLISVALKTHMDIQEGKLVQRHTVRLDFAKDMTPDLEARMEPGAMRQLRQVKAAVKAYHDAGFHIEADAADEKRREFYGRVLTKMGLKPVQGHAKDVWNVVPVEVENVFCATGPGGGIDPTCPAGGRGTALVDRLNSRSRSTKNSEANALMQEAAKLSNKEAAEVLKQTGLVPGKNPRKELVESIEDRQGAKLRSGAMYRAGSAEHKEFADMGDEPLLSSKSLVGDAPAPAKTPSASSIPSTDKPKSRRSEPSGPPTTEAGRSVSALYQRAAAASESDISSAREQIASMTAAERKAVAESMGLSGKSGAKDILSRIEERREAAIRRKLIDRPTSNSNRAYVTNDFADNVPEE